MYKFSEEAFVDCYFEMIPLLNLHYKEISANLDIELAPDVERYKALEASGNLKIYVARDEESLAIIGYAVYFVAPHIHYLNSLTATQDVVFIHPKRRGFGKGFIARCDEELRNIGVQVVFHHVKVKHDWGNLLLTLGYKHVEHIYSRRLDKES